MDRVSLSSVDGIGDTRNSEQNHHLFILIVVDAVVTMGSALEIG
jgi:hypothetical protein